jgi:hypothetical protein
MPLPFQKTKVQEHIRELRARCLGIPSFSLLNPARFVTVVDDSPLFDCAQASHREPPVGSCIGLSMILVSCHIDNGARTSSPLFNRVCCELSINLYNCAQPSSDLFLRLHPTSHCDGGQMQRESERNDEHHKASGCQGHVLPDSALHCHIGRRRCAMSARASCCMEQISD